MDKELLILVDEKDNQIGTLDKLTVHQTGRLHRAFSVFIFNSKNELLLQQRADDKYHSPGLWSNTCCSHPTNGEPTGNAVSRRLKEELNIECHSSFAFSFIYKTQFTNGLTEHEYDHVYFGKCDAAPVPNPREVKDWKYMNLQDLHQDILENPDNYTEWLKICLPKVMQHFVNQHWL
ncbi:isopentenyl-diphosphate Delta-isomerase [Terrimonas pollutisoli]|uniref:isopentenyl-diphosphate Delta-isomerase n=1 Tax=Terrimonas pollutisoli TaxID=3034147 RepID=UPI0023ED2769|nr:isopentenyl-diphosphate Delta-isomerase [Terrimonas sp. H1YJ31]